MLYLDKAFQYFLVRALRQRRRALSFQSALNFQKNNLMSLLFSREYLRDRGLPGYVRVSCLRTNKVQNMTKYPEKHSKTTP